MKKNMKPSIFAYCRLQQQSRGGYLRAVIRKSNYNYAVNVILCISVPKISMRKLQNFRNDKHIHQCRRTESTCIISFVYTNSKCTVKQNMTHSHSQQPQENSTLERNLTKVAIKLHYNETSEKKMRKTLEDGKISHVQELALYQKLFRDSIHCQLKSPSHPSQKQEKRKQPKLYTQKTKYSK